MPAEDLLVQRISDWSNGPWHQLGPIKGPLKGYMYDCVNMHLYDNGLLGVRPALKWIASSNFSRMALDGFAHIKNNFDWSPDGDGFLVVFTGSTTCTRINTRTGAVTTVTIGTAAAFDMPPQNPADNLPFGSSGIITCEQHGDDDFILAGDSHISGISGVPSATAFTFPPGWAPHTTIQFRDRYWSYGDVSNANRIHFSDPGAFTWDTLNFFDVGPASTKAIVGIFPLYDSLIIAMKDHTWFSYTFTTDPLLGEIRYIGIHPLPDYAVSVANTGEALYFLTKYDGVAMITPSGIDTQTESHIGSGSAWFYVDGRALVARNTDGILIPQRASGSWSTMERTNGRWFQSDYLTLSQIPQDAFDLNSEKYGFCLMVDTAGTQPLQIVSREINLGYCNGQVDQHGSSSSTAFWGTLDLPVWAAPEGALSAVRKITVEFAMWTSFGFDTLNPRFDVYVDGVLAGRFSHADNPGDTVATVTSGDPRLNVFTLFVERDIMKRHHQITFRNIRAVAFSEVTVHYDVQPQEVASSKNAIVL